MTLLVDESFEGSGYEESWTEDAAGGTVNEDSTALTPPTGGGSQILEVNGHADCFARRDLGSAQAVTYTRAYIAVHSHDASLWWDIIRLDVATDLQEAWKIELKDSGGDVYFRFRGYNNGSLSIDDRYPGSGSSISLDTWYKLEVKYDTTGMTWEWKIDDVSQGSGSLTGTIRVPRYLKCGPDESSGYDANTYYDLVAMDDAGYPADPVSGNPWYYYEQQVGAAQ